VLTTQSFSDARPVGDSSEVVSDEDVYIYPERGVSLRAERPHRNMWSFYLTLL